MNLKNNSEKSADRDIFERLASHLSMTGIPLTDALVALVAEAFSQTEAQIALNLTPWPIPLKTESLEKISKKSGLGPDQVREVLDKMVEKRLIFCRTQLSGNNGSPVREYALHHAGFGFPQSFFWDGDRSQSAKAMSRLVIDYFNLETTKQAFGGTPTKPYRYIPIHKSVKPDLQSVLPHDQMETIVKNAESIAVAHCPCRVQASLWGRGCDHPTEVCLKFDELADYLVERGLGRRIDKDEALQIIDKAAEAGLVHFVDNVTSKVKHNCNCCGCACWNVGAIRRRRIARDDLMAVYYIRGTDKDLCVDCGQCLDICPVNAVSLEDGVICVDENWCIGCGVCTTQCDMDAIEMVPRKNRPSISETFTALYDKISAERGLKDK